MNTRCSHFPEVALQSVENCALSDTQIMQHAGPSHTYKYPSIWDISHMKIILRITSHLRYKPKKKTFLENLHIFENSKPANLLLYLFMQEIPLIAMNNLNSYIVSTLTTVE